MRRRDFLKTAGAAAAALSTRRMSAADKDRPNLVIVHTDEHNFRTLGCYRAVLAPKQALVWGPKTVVTTPNIDWLAKRGALCTSFYATTPVCSPSRAAFVSGRYPQNTPVVTNNIPLADEIVTFAEILRRKGYATGYAGKWHLDGGGKPQWAPQRKFGFTDNRYMFNRGHWKQMHDTPQGPRIKARSGQGKPNYGVAGADQKTFTTDFLADKAVEFIQAHKGEPFCYMVSLPDPHGPNTVRAPYDTMFEKLKFQPPPTLSKPAANLPSWGKKQVARLQGRSMARYFGMVKCIDDNVGKIVKAIHAANVMPKTIIVFTSDHGDLCGEHGRHNKGVPYEASAKVPFVMHYLAKVKSNTVIHEALGCVDFLPTIISLMGFETPGKEQGRDASALFTTGKAPADWTDIAFLRSTGGVEGWVAAVTKRYKLVLSSRDEPWLFDLEKDPDELTNFFRQADYRDTVRDLGGRLADYCKKYTDPRGQAPRIQADLKWAVEGTAPYKPPVGLPAAPARPGRRKKKRRKKNPAAEK